ncbi:uncharacterized protein LOC124436972 isoform X2 [Xenia sp. Carnegie-2017]|uniref:uncharacterized protein LOC124436972 isoform X2 n=1 Tax=Xenia sp. Carnegie-2017 TaxID=2897299 RepID=UPI001F03F09B|nr:uncharacterized protein LOC124436972 isoform X2 [Xenia sp. Carnegie-2017]
MKLGIVIFTFFAVITSNLSSKPVRNTGLLFTQWTRTEPNATCDANMNNCKYYIEICWNWLDNNQSRCFLAWLKRSYTYTMKPTQTRRFSLFYYFSRNIHNPLWKLVDIWSDRMTIVEINIYQEGKGPNPVERLNISKRLQLPIRDMNKLHDDTYNITGSKFRVYGAIYMWCDDNCVPPTTVPTTLPTTLPTIAPPTPPSKPYSKPTSPKPFAHAVRNTGLLFTQWTRTEPNETCDANMNNCKYYIEICWSWRDYNQSRCSLGWLKRSYTYTMKPTQTRRFLLYDYFSKNVFNPVWTLVDMWRDRMTIVEINIYQEGKGPNPVERLNISKRLPYPIRDMNKLHDDTYNITGSKFRVYGAIYMWCDDNCVPQPSLPTTKLPTTLPTTFTTTLPTIAPSTPPSKPYSKPTSPKPVRNTGLIFTQWTRTEPNETCDANMNNCKYYIEICWSWRDHNQSKCSLGWLKRSYTYTMKPTQTRRFSLFHYFSRNDFNPLWKLVDIWSDRMTIVEINIYQEGKGPNPVERLNISKRLPYPIRDMNKLHDNTYNITGSKFRVYGAIYMWCDDNCVPQPSLPTTKLPTTLPTTLPTIAPPTPPSKPYSKPTSPKALVKAMYHVGLIINEWTRSEPNETCNANMNNCKYYIEICWSWRDHNQSRCSLGWLKRSYTYTMKPTRRRTFKFFDYLSPEYEINPVLTLLNMWSDRMTVVEFNIYQEGKGPNPVERLNISKRLPYPINDICSVQDDTYNITGSKFRVLGAIYMWCDDKCVPRTKISTTKPFTPPSTSSTPPLSKRTTNKNRPSFWPLRVGGQKGGEIPAK